MPIVMAVANRCIGGPINIHNDHSDAMGARDCGLDTDILREQPRGLRHERRGLEDRGAPRCPDCPVMVNFDGFTISHTMENVYILEDADVKKFVGKRIYHEDRGPEG